MTPMPPLTGDPGADAFLAALAARARALLGDALVGAYLLGSAARGDYLPGRSDLDVALVVRSPLDETTKRRIVADARAIAAPPSPRLELVAYRADVAGSPGARPAFELNLNTGGVGPDRVSLDPRDEPWFWFLLDLAAAADAAKTIEGRSASRVFGPVPREAVLEALAASLAWHAEHEEASANRVLNACRAWCWLDTGAWRSKSAAAHWAIDAGADVELVGHAAALRAGTRADPLEPSRVRALDRLVAERMHNARA